MYTFRVLRDDELIEKRHISASGSFEPEKDLKSLLSTLNSHVKKGGSKTSPWISLSSDFLRDVERYNMPLRGHNNERKRMAVIRDYDKTCILTHNHVSSDDSLLHMPVYKFSKIVLDYSTAKSVKEIKEKGLAVNVKGEVTTNYSRTHAYSQHDKELLVYGKIPATNVEVVLSPFDVDVLYTMLASSEFGNQEECLDYYLYYVMDAIERDPSKLGLTPVEELLFREFYGNNKHLVTVATEILKANNINYSLVKKSDWDVVDVLDLTKDGIIYNYSEGIDILNIFAYLKRKKRVILKKIFASAGVDISTIKLPEDVMQLVRIGHVKQDGVLRVFYKGEQLFIPPQSYDLVAEGTYPNLENVSIAVMHGNTEVKDDNMYWLSENDEIVRKAHDYDSSYLSTRIGTDGIKILRLFDFD